MQKSIRFEMGQKVQCAPDCGERSGMLGVITGLPVMRFGFAPDGRGKKAYRVKWADGAETPATQVALQPAPPSRADNMDTKVGWCWFDPDVARAIKGEAA